MRLLCLFVRKYFNLLYWLFKLRNLSFYIKRLSIACLIVVFIGVGIFLSYRNEVVSFLDKVNSYILKFIVFLLFSLIFLMGFLSRLENNILFILALFTLLIYSICFLKYIMDVFKNFIFLIANLIFIYLYNLLIIEFTFGAFYLNNNIYYSLFENPNAMLINANLKVYITIVNKGLYYFYNYPSILNIKYVFNSCIPFFEYIFGATFNIAIIGFFISYTASKAFSNNFKDNLNKFEQLKNREFKVTIKKEPQCCGRNGHIIEVLFKA